MCDFVTPKSGSSVPSADGVPPPPPRRRYHNNETEASWEQVPYKKYGSQPKRKQLHKTPRRVPKQ